MEQVAWGHHQFFQLGEETSRACSRPDGTYTVQQPCPCQIVEVVGIDAEERGKSLVRFRLEHVRSRNLKMGDALIVELFADSVCRVICGNKDGHSLIVKAEIVVDHLRDTFFFFVRRWVPRQDKVKAFMLDVTGGLWQQ